MFALALAEGAPVSCSQDAQHKVTSLQYTIKCVNSCKALESLDAAVRMVSLLDDLRVFLQHGVARHSGVGEEEAQKALDSGKQMLQNWASDSKEKGLDQMIRKYMKHVKATSRQAPIVHDIKSKRMSGPPQWMDAMQKEAAQARNFSLLMSNVLDVPVPAGFSVSKVESDSETPAPPKSVCLYLSLSRVAAMAKEREALCSMVLPAVHAWCLACGVSFTWVDGSDSSPDAFPTDNQLVRCARLMDACTVGGKTFLFVLAPSGALVQGSPRKAPSTRPSTRFATGDPKSSRFKRVLARMFSDIFDAWSYFDINGDWNVSTNEFVRMAAALGVAEVSLLLVADITC